LPSAGVRFRQRVGANFLAALNAAKISVNINTTLRPPQRSYLMYYACDIKADLVAAKKAAIGMDTAYDVASIIGKPTSPTTTVARPSTCTSLPSGASGRASSMPRARRWRAAPRRTASRWAPPAVFFTGTQGAQGEDRRSALVSNRQLTRAPAAEGQGGAARSQKGSAPRLVATSCARSRTRAAISYSL
jgi:hypothetical protein